MQMLVSQVILSLRSIVFPARRRHFWSLGRGGSTALEFALVGVPFITMTLGVMEIGFDAYSQQVLDAATQSVARQFRTGSWQTSGLSPSAFAQQQLCTSMNGLLSCTNISFSMKVVTDYWNAATGQIPTTNGVFLSSSLSVCHGSPGQAMLFQTFYPAPAFITALFPIATVIFNNTTVNMLTSSAAFMNEQYTVAGSGSSGC